ncbi:hypothetical protein L1049_024242 [Liquidambar formosana]|uniref:Uncharacterized protein n=1 Tax=Liquidambar formosana TaxID=63359 RepID=A0AAP0RUZ3_LIQFO
MQYFKNAMPIIKASNTKHVKHMIWWVKFLRLRKPFHPLAEEGYKAGVPTISSTVKQLNWKNPSKSLPIKKNRVIFRSKEQVRNLTFPKSASKNINATSGVQRVPQGISFCLSPNYKT